MLRWLLSLFLESDNSKRTTRLKFIIRVKGKVVAKAASLAEAKELLENIFDNADFKACSRGKMGMGSSNKSLKNRRKYFMGSCKIERIVRYA